MRVVLINPLWSKGRRLRGPVYNRVWPPLSLATAAAMMRDAGVDVDLIDANAERIPASKLASMVRADMAFVTSSTLDKWVCPNTELDPFMECVEAVKGVVDRVVVVGVHGTVKPWQMLRATGAYAVVMGEPEATMTDLARGMPRETTPGVAYLGNGTLVTTEPRPLMDLAQLPPPAMDLLPLHRYRYEILGDRLMLLEATRGCPHACTFCLRAMYGGRAFRKKTPAQIRTEIRRAVVDHGAKSLYFMDIEFTISRPTALAVCDAMEEVGPIPWCCQTRADSLDEELVRRLKDAGCRLVHFGVESGSDRILALVRKGETTEAIRRGVRMVQRAGMETACFFMFGFPTETREEMEQTIRFAKELAPTYASFHVVEPYPGTPLAHEVAAQVEGEFFPFTYRFPGVNLKRIQRAALVSYYLRPSYAFHRLTSGSWRMLAQQIRIFADYLR